MNMYALCISRFVGGIPSGKPDGVFIRKDGSTTGNKASTLLFETADMAAAYVPGWRQKAGVEYHGPLFVVEVTVKPVRQSIIGVERKL